MPYLCEMRKKSPPASAPAYPPLPTARWVPLADLRKNPDNPRTIRDHAFEKLVTSLRTFPEMLRLRPVVIASWAEPVILGGNMRYEAAKIAGLQAVPVLAAEELTPAQRREFVIRDNVSGGEWDWDALANGWDAGELEAWGLELPGAPAAQAASEDTTPSALTFHLPPDQRERVEAALAHARAVPEIGRYDAEANPAEAALLLICDQWTEEKSE